MREAGETAGAYAIGLGTLAVSDPHYVLKLSDQPIMFTIRPYRAEATFSPETANGNSGWYCTDVIITPPTGHSISVDGGQTWVSGSITLNENTGLFDYLLRSDQEDATKNAIANNSIQLNIDKISPVFTGIADRQDYCLSANFQVTDAHLKEVAVDGRAILPEEGVYFLKPGIHTVTATDLAGNTTIVTVSVHEKHTFSELSTNAEHHWYDCVMCGETVKEEAHSLKWVIIREATSTEPGLKQNRCTVCGYVQSTDEIPANRPTTPSIPPETTEPEDELPAPDDSETEPEKPEESISPETGDGSNLKWPVLLLICAGGFLGITFILQRQNCE